MKTIGIIGGLAWPSTAVYYQKIVMPSVRGGIRKIGFCRGRACRGPVLIGLARKRTSQAKPLHERNTHEPEVTIEDSPVPIIDTTVAHIEAAVKTALAD